MDKKVLIIEDETAIADLVSYSLRKEGFNTKLAYDGEQGIREINECKPNLIILDLMLPDMSGFDVCRYAAKQGDISIIMLTAKTDIIDKVLGLELGADDYITKPFDIRELTARVKSVFRRIEQVVELRESVDRSVLDIAPNVKLYKDEHKVLRDGEVVELTPKEYKLLEVMGEDKGVVFSREKLLDKVWGYEYLGDSRTVDIHIQRIRKKLKDNNMYIIETVFGVGYKIS